LTNFKRVLVLSPHTDDGEIGAGAYINQLINSGSEVKYVAFSSCQESLAPDLPKDILIKECNSATKTLGINDVQILDFPVRRFPEYRQEILEKLIEIRSQFNPDLVIIPSSADVHQDHSVIYSEGVRAFKNTTLIGYYFPWNCINFTSSLVIEVSAEEIQIKEQSIAMYKSQSKRFYAKKGYIYNMCKYQGDNNNMDFAELYEVIRWVIKK
jgi:LmbE family N-acetylglucosaminyl deacetylase